MMVNKAYDEQMKVWLEKNRETIIEKWMDLIRIPSVKADPLPNAPFGAECARALKTSAAYLEELGLPVKLNEAEGYAVAQYGSGEKSIGLFAHSDVVPAGDGWIYTEPFQPVIRNGVLVGRGVGDNKSGVMASWCVLSMLKECGIPVNSRIQVFVGSNEESGMQDIEAYARDEVQPDICLVPDSSFPCGIGEKGILRMWAKCDKPMEAVRSMEGGNAFNIVLNQVTTLLEPNAALLEELKEKCAAAKEYELSVEQDGTIRLIANGIAMHAAYLEGSLNATWLTVKLLASCENLPAEDREIFETVERYLQGYWGEGLKIDHTDPDAGKLSCANGMVKMEDGHLMVSLDIRYGVTCGPRELEQKLAEAWESVGWQITYLNNRPGYMADLDCPYPARLKAVAEELTGKEMKYYLMNGGTYGRYLRTAFPVGTTATPLVSPAVGLEMPSGHGAAHQRDEAVSLDSFFLGVRILAHDVLACDEALTGKV